jgi:hypothetical protein
MLADVLFEAIQDIEFYQEEYPQLYEPYRAEIDYVKKLMQALQIKLDTQPGHTPTLLA